MEAHSKVVLNDSSPTRDVRGYQSAKSVHRMSRWWVQLCLIASHGKPFQNLAQTTSCCYLSGIRILRWSMSIPEDTPTTPMQIGLFHKCLNISIHAVLSVGSLSRPLEAFCNLCRACAKALPIDVRPFIPPSCSRRRDLGMALF